MRRHGHLLLFGIAGLLLVGACSGDTSEKDSADTTTASDVATDATPDSATADTAPDTGTDSGEESDTLPEPDYNFVSFQYHTAGDAGMGGGERGLRVKFYPGQKRIYKVGNNEFDKPLSDQLARELHESFLTDEVRQKMKNKSWECGSKTKLNGVEHVFQVQLDPGMSSDNVTSNITGCIPDDSTENDAQLVQKIADKFDELRQEKFN